MSDDSPLAPALLHVGVGEEQHSHTHQKEKARGG